MATAAPHVKLLRQLAHAKDDYLSGALDITWQEGNATLFLVFGQPSHATFDSPGRMLEGDHAVAAMQGELPRDFEVGQWRRAMSPRETLRLSLAELIEPFVEQAGAQAESIETPTVDDAAWWSAEDDSPALGFGLADFPVLPAGEALWPDGAPAEVRLEARLASLPPAAIVLSGPRLRAAGVVSGGELIDAVWVDSDDHVRGESAAMAMLGAKEGTLSGVRLDPPELADALPGLWRYPVAASGIELAWLNPETMIGALKADETRAILLVDAPDRGVALFAAGRLVAVYSNDKRTPSQSEYALKALLAQERGTLVVLRPAGAAAAMRPVLAATSVPAAAPPAATTAVAGAGDAAAQAEPSWYAEVTAVPEPAVEPAAAPPPAAAAEPPPVLPAAAAVAAPPEVDAEQSGLVDFDEVKQELIAIGLEWLGDPGAAPVTDLIRRTRPTVDDFVTLIDTIRGLRVPGFEPSAVQSMAKEMHRHAAERLCGA